MNPHDWYVENRAAFVARAPRAGEERTFREHLPRCEECRAGGAPAGAGAGLAHDGHRRRWRPAPGFTRRLAAAVLDRPRRWQVVLPSALAAAALLLAVGLGCAGAPVERRCSRPRWPRASIG